MLLLSSLTLYRLIGAVIENILKVIMKIRFGFCRPSHSDTSNFSEGKEKVRCRLKTIGSSRATGITLLYKTLKKFCREVDWNKFSDEGERLKMGRVSVGSGIG